jgi:hypothetical protein
MPKFCANAAVWLTLALAAPCFDADLVFAGPSTDETEAPEKAAPQGTDPPGADNGDAPTPPLVEKNGVIKPPPIGDEDIYTQAPNPDAGHEKEVIPPPGTPGAPDAPPP